MSHPPSEITPIGHVIPAPWDLDMGSGHGIWTGCIAQFNQDTVQHEFETRSGAMTTGYQTVNEQLYRNHHGWLHGWLHHRLGCSETAADLAQDTFLRLLTKPRPLTDLDNARSYLRTVADRLCIDMWRRKSVEQAWLEVLAARPEEVAISPEEHAIIVETFCEIDAMLQRLPEKVAQAFLLSQLNGLTYKQIAEQMGVSDRTIKSYMAKAMLECMLIEARFHGVDN